MPIVFRRLLFRTNCAETLVVSSSLSILRSFEIFSDLTVAGGVNGKSSVDDISSIFLFIGVTTSTIFVSILVSVDETESVAS